MVRYWPCRCSPFIALLIWNKQRQSSSNELVIGISPPFANPLQVLRMKQNKV
jgi:hypothetical protein